MPDNLERALADATPSYPGIISAEPWRMPDGSAGLQILAGANDHPLVSVTCVSGTVNVRFVTDFAFPGSDGTASVVLKALGDDMDSATFNARQVNISPVPTETGGSTGYIIVSRPVASFEPDDALTENWTMPSGSDGKEILGLINHPLVTVTCNPGRAISGWRWGGLIMVCGGKVGGTLTERERSRDDQIAMGGSRRFTRLTKTSSKPGSWSSGCSLMNAITLR